MARGAVAQHDRKDVVFIQSSDGTGKILTVTPAFDPEADRFHLRRRNLGLAVERHRAIVNHAIQPACVWIARDYHRTRRCPDHDSLKRAEVQSALLDIRVMATQAICFENWQYIPFEFARLDLGPLLKLSALFG